jgi:hypothetical protein
MVKVSDAEYLRRAKTFPPVPADFDPHLAGNDELVRRGFPRRPDRKPNRSLVNSECVRRRPREAFGVPGSRQEEGVA